MTRTDPQGPTLGEVERIVKTIRDDYITTAQNRSSDSYGMAMSAIDEAQAEACDRVLAALLRAASPENTK